MSDKFSLKFLETIKNQARDLKVQKVLATISGGADSIALTYALKKTGIVVHALHCDFHLRGDESERDRIFVEEFCKTYEIPLSVKHFDVNAHLNGNNKRDSIEMACRKLRYEWFNKKLNETEYDRLATGHNADDNIETFFLNLLRGSGTRGLKGMRIDNGFIWRPLLNFHRKDILKFLEENSLHYIIDSTNLKNDFRRNFLRNEVIPLFKSEWKGFDKAMDTSLAYLQDENNIIENAIILTLPHNNNPLTIDKILNFPAPKLLIKRYIDILQPYTTTAQEVLDAIKANKPHIRKWNLRLGSIILRNGKLFIKMIHRESRS